MYAGEDSFYNSVDREPDCCLGCKHPLSYGHNDWLCNRCNIEDVKPFEYHKNLDRHFNNCLCSDCWQKKMKNPSNNTRVAEKIFSKELNLGLHAIRYFKCVLDQLDFYELLHFGNIKCQWDGFSEKCICEKFYVEWEWIQFEGILKPKSTYYETVNYRNKALQRRYNKSTRTKYLTKN